MTFRTIILTAIGKLVVCGNEHGVISLGWTDEELSEDIEQESKEWIEKIRSLDFDVPFVLTGTDFQIKVWKEIHKVRPGKTISYGELANRIGNPGAVRAVATACGKNKIALIIPCHRIVRGDGSIGKYAWGVDRKKMLLELESE